MARPRPLTNLASARPSPSGHQLLTPRTPHSRSGRAEEGYTEFELQQVTERDDDYRAVGQQQVDPLLASSASDTFPPDGFRSRGDDYDGTSKNYKRTGQLGISTVLSQLPLVASVLLAVILLVLFVVSLERPDVLHKYVGVSVPDDTPPPTSPKPTTLHNVLLYENYTTFPLLPSEYLAECTKLNAGYMSHGEYWEPHSMGVLDVVHHDDHHDYKLPEGERTAVCKSTITYMLDGKVGLFADLALMAQAAALARERNRTFLIDDTYWNRGKWTDHFQDVRVRQPGPERGCRAPPPEELVACPRLARHWVINSRTAKFHFGHGFSNHYEDPYGHQLNRLKPIFSAATVSFEKTIRPNAHNAGLIRSARLELSKLMSLDGASSSPYIGIHIRRGDRKSASYSYPGRYVPTLDFVEAVTSTWARLKPENAIKEPIVYVASDSPSAQQDFVELSQSRRTTFSLLQSTDSQLRALASPSEYVQKDFDVLDEEVRIDATRGVIIDFALSNGMWAWDGEIVPDATVCTISSNICKLSAIGLGWNRAFGAVDEMGRVDEKHKRWIEIDQKGQVVPVWEPFEMF